MTQNTDDNTVPQTGALIPQKHGGALRNGGPGSPGRPPSEIRKRLRGSFEERMHVLEEIADGVVTIHLKQKCEHCGEEPTAQSPLQVNQMVRSVAGDKLRALEVMLKHGLGPGMSVDEVRDKVRATKDAAEEILPPELAEAFVKELKRIWLGES